MSIRQNIIKEMRYGIRNSKLLILAAGFFFFALLDPLMLKVVLPMALKSQFPNLPMEALEAMIQSSQVSSIQNYMNDIFEMGTLITAFTLCGIIAQEIRDRTWIFPLCSGKRFGGILAGKFMVFGIAIMLISTAALFTNALYSGLLMGFELDSWLPILKGGLLQGLYMVFVLSCLMAFGALLKRPIATGISALILAYGSTALGELFDVSEYLPGGLLNEAMNLSEKASSTLPITVLISLAVIAALYGLTLVRVKHMELGGGASA